MIIAIFTGILIYPWVEYVTFLSPYLISTMLVFTFSSMSVRELKIQKSHIFILLMQITTAGILYLLFEPFNKILAMGIMMCSLCPTASAAPAMVKMLGGDVSYVATYLLFVNLVMSIFIPIAFSLVMNNAEMAFSSICLGIMKKVGALLIIPLLLARFLKHTFPKVNKLLIKHSGVTFYIWAVALVIAIANTIHFFITHNVEHSMLCIMATASLIMCLLQFGTGRLLGAHYNKPIAICQSLGQKNTILAIWMSQTFLHPLSSIMPACYVLWQNLANTLQLARGRKNK